MKRGNELGLSPIKTENREGNTAVKELHYKANDIIFKYSKKYISPMVAAKIEKQLTEIGIQLNEIDYQKARPKVEEILSKIRGIIYNLRSYNKEFKWSDEDLQQIQTSINYWVREAVKHKQEGTLFQNAIELLQEQKELTAGMGIVENRNRLNVKAFADFNRELIQSITEHYTVAL